MKIYLGSRSHICSGGCSICLYNRDLVYLSTSSPFSRVYPSVLADINTSPATTSVCAYQKTARRPSSLDPPPHFDLLLQTTAALFLHAHFSRQPQQGSEHFRRIQCRTNLAINLYPLSVVHLSVDSHATLWFGAEVLSSNCLKLPRILKIHAIPPASSPPNAVRQSFRLFQYTFSALTRVTSGIRQLVSCCIENEEAIEAKQDSSTSLPSCLIHLGLFLIA